MDKELKSFQRMFAVVWGVALIGSLASLAFVVWVIVSLLKHFGIV